MNTNPDFSEKHRKLVVLHEHISALTEQLSTEHYPSLPVYLNNLEHLSKYFEAVSDISSLKGLSSGCKRRIQSFSSALSVMSVHSYCSVICLVI